MTKVLVGIDPEVFLYDFNKQKFISAIGKVGGTKEQPRPIGNGCAVQEDNMAVEFNTPATDVLSSFRNNINYVKGWLVEQLPDINLSFKPSVVFDEEETKDPRAWEFGCDPDYNAYSMEENPKPTAKNKFKRTAGGHIHFGYDGHNPEKNSKLIQVADLILGVPSIMMDTDTERREMYGKAGAFRHKAYGAEYRTLSNFWCENNTLIDWAFNNSMRVFEQFSDESIEITDNLRVMIRKAINTNDKKVAEFLIRKYGLEVA